MGGVKIVKWGRWVGRWKGKCCERDGRNSCRMGLCEVGCFVWSGDVAEVWVGPLARATV